MDKIFRSMTNEEWKNRDRLFEPALEIKSFVKEEDVNEVRVYAIEKGTILGWSVAETHGYAISYFMNGAGETLEFPEETDIFKIIEKATQLINFIKL